MLFWVLFSSKSTITENLLTTVDQLKQGIVEERNKLSQCFIEFDRSIDEWRRRLTRVVQQQGGHIEHNSMNQ